MLKIRLLILLYLILPYAMNAQNFIVEGLKHQYRSVEKIKYTIEYSPSDMVFVSIGLEKEFNNQWVEITDDISKKSLGSMRVEVIRLYNNGKNLIEWVPNSLPQMGGKKSVKGRFRFVFYYAASIQNLNEHPLKWYSSDFNVR